MQEKQLDLFPKLKPRTKEELAVEYGYSSRTIRRMCHEIGINSQRRLTTIELQTFYDFFGPPEIIYEYWKK